MSYVDAIRRRLLHMLSEAFKPATVEVHINLIGG
jgi:hypothetical protein